MENSEFILVDGQVITEELLNEMSIRNFIVKAHNGYFTVDSKVKANFVGFIELKNDDGEIIRIWSYPKEYFIDETKDDLNIEDKKLVLKTIKHASKYSEEILGSGNNNFTNIDAIKTVLDYYNNYGLYTVDDKVHKNLQSGRINWSKTIKKKRAVVSNQNLIYTDFIVKKKNRIETIVTQAMSYILKEVVPSYDFLFKKPNCNGTYDKRIFKNYKHVVALLEQEKNATFKDMDKKLIHALLVYFSSDSGNSMSVNLATSNFNLVWEAMVSEILGMEKGNFNVGIGHGKNAPYKIEPDHLDMKKHIIADSKYYTYNEKNGLDYKQMFYFYHIVTSQAITNSENIDIIELHKTWSNYLIKPGNVSKDVEKKFTKRALIARNSDEEEMIKDFMNIDEIYVHPKVLMNLFDVGKTIDADILRHD